MVPRREWKEKGLRVVVVLLPGLVVEEWWVEEERLVERMERARFLRW